MTDKRTIPPIATDERGRIVMTVVEWAARSEALSRAMKSAGSRTDETTRDAEDIDP